MKHLIPLFLVAICLCSCIEENHPEERVVEGVRPIYAGTSDWQHIQSGEARSIRRLGKIYYKDGFIFVNELNQGIHIIDNSNPDSPQPIHFISVPGSKDIAIKGDYLYSDNLTDLVVLDISDFNDIQLINRIPDVYPLAQLEFPDFWIGYFECPDSEKGAIVGWETATLTNPQCRR